MSSPVRGREVPPATRQEVSPKIPPVAPPSGSFINWAERVQSTHARHDAITRNLNSWSNYKSWAERMRNAWEEEPARETPQAGRHGGRNPPNH